MTVTTVIAGQVMHARTTVEQPLRNCGVGHLVGSVLDHPNPSHTRRYVVSPSLPPVWPQNRQDVARITGKKVTKQVREKSLEWKKVWNTVPYRPIALGLRANFLKPTLRGRNDALRPCRVNSMGSILRITS